MNPENASSSTLLQTDQTDKSARRLSTLPPRNDKNDQSTAQEQLKAKGFLPKQWVGKCEADKVSMGTYDITAGQGGMYGLIFDTLSLFSLSTYFEPYEFRSLSQAIIVSDALKSA